MHTGRADSASALPILGRAFELLDFARQSLTKRVLFHAITGEEQSVGQGPDEGLSVRKTVAFR